MALVVSIAGCRRGDEGEHMGFLTGRGNVNGGIMPRLLVECVEPGQTLLGP